MTNNKYNSKSYFLSAFSINIHSAAKYVIKTHIFSIDIKADVSGISCDIFNSCEVSHQLTTSSLLPPDHNLEPIVAYKYPAYATPIIFVV